jgi:hypothetical protein
MHFGPNFSYLSWYGNMFIYFSSTFGQITTHVDSNASFVPRSCNNVFLCNNGSFLGGCESMDWFCVPWLRARDGKEILTSASVPWSSWTLAPFHFPWFFEHNAHYTDRIDASPTISGAQRASVASCS